MRVMQVTSCHVVEEAKGTELSFRQLDYATPSLPANVDPNLQAIEKPEHRIGYELFFLFSKRKVYISAIDYIVFGESRSFSFDLS